MEPLVTRRLRGGRCLYRARMSLAALAWRCGTTLATPLLPLWLRYRLARGKELAVRLPERRGLRAARPPGPLLWLHAASIGETLSLLPVLDRLRASAERLKAAQGVTADGGPAAAGP